MFFSKLFYKTILGLLTRYARKNSVISRCYIRHSAAFKEQNLFLSDFDLVFFVNARSLQELQRVHRQIGWDMDHLGIFKKKVSHIIILPATKEAYDLCASSYPFRSIYPINSWLEIGKNKRPEPSRQHHRIPLDHTPENSLFYYIIPVLRGEKKRHLCERAFLRRTIKKDCLWAGVENTGKPASFYRTMLAEIAIWDTFYKRMPYRNHTAKIPFNGQSDFNYTVFLEPLEAIRHSLDEASGLSSIWACPGFLDVGLPCLVVNFNLSISAQKCRMVLKAILNELKNLNYTLLIGTEASMIGRINSLSRLNILEPWLFKYYGRCLIGDPDIKQNIREPGRDMLKIKYQEFLLYFFYEHLAKNQYAYNFYMLCFIMDRLFRHGEICLNEKRLSRIYGREFTTRNKFNPQNDSSALLSFLANRQGFHMFGTPLD